MKSLNSIIIANVKLKNRICIAPMCQYSAKNGNPSQWHYRHLSKLMEAGAGLLILNRQLFSKGNDFKNDLSLINKKLY